MFRFQQNISGSHGNCGVSPGCFVNSEVQFAGVTASAPAASNTLLPLSGFCQLSHVLLRVNPIIVLLKGYT